MISRFRKGLIIGLLLLIITSIPLMQGFGGSVVYAQGASPGSGVNLEKADGIGQAATNDFITMLETLNKGIYMILWPSLAVGGAALSNDLVYGKAFFLDRSLWKFWQMMRTFGNFTLGFLFIGTILMAFFKQNEDTSWVKKLFKRLVVAGILINFSRWMIAAMIDLSTIGVVAMGGLPLSVMGSNKDGNKDVAREKITFLKSHSLIDLAPSNDKNQDLTGFGMAYSCAGNESAQKYYLPCYSQNGKLVERGSPDEPGTWGEYQEQAVKSWVSFNENGKAPINVSSETINAGFCVYGTDLIANQFGASISEPAMYEFLLEKGVDHKETAECSVLGDLAAFATPSTGPLYTLYGSIFAMGNIGMTTNFGSASEVGFEMMMKGFVGLALIIPLIILCVVLVVRVIFLWLIIAFSPLLVIAYAFEFKGIENAQEGKFKLANIVSLIFLPVFAVFALSISIVFLSILQNVKYFEVVEGKHPEAKEQECGAKNDALTALKIAECVKKDGKDKCYEFMGIQTICFDEGDRVLGSNIVNVMTWMVLNFFGIALMWTVFMFVLKSNAITGKIAGTMEGFAKSGLMSLPIIPVGGGTSLGAVKETAARAQRKMDDYQLQQYNGSGLGGYLDHKGAQLTGAANDTVEQMSAAPSTGGLLSTNGSAATNTNIIDPAYDRAVPSTIKEMNSKVEAYNTANPSLPQLNQIDEGSISSMNNLIMNEDYQNYADTVLGRDYQENFMNNRGKTNNPTAKAELSQVYATGLAKAAHAAGAENGYVYPGDGRNRTSTHGNDSNNVEYIQANGILKRIQWGKTRGTNPRWVIKGVKTYKLPTKGIKGDVQLKELFKLVQEEGGWANLNAEMKKQYYDGTNFEEAIKQTIKREGGEGRTINGIAIQNVNDSGFASPRISITFTGEAEKNPVITNISLTNPGT